MNSIEYAIENRPTNRVTSGSVLKKSRERTEFQEVASITQNSVELIKTDVEQFKLFHELLLMNAPIEYKGIDCEENENLKKKRLRRPRTETDRLKDKERYQKDREKILARKKKQYADDIDVRRERSRLNGRKQYALHTDRTLKRVKKHREENKEHYREYDKERYSTDEYKEYNRNYMREYLRLPHPRLLHKRRVSIRNRSLGLEPVNSMFVDSEFHHMYLNGSKDIGIFLPHDIHRSVKHSGITQAGIREVNMAALLWLCEQSVI